ncbi:uncharacterized protein LOC100906828 [Galendromus occidentalis]|uniref:Uncharacterized protein LOC100906828 n=1 Tax=Galendromus occidentalis TaxID=34638 RepID=A0AAJ6QNN9_9ACAR|nr:uncharacterized protein LOC100906828 [Galendromus occidentalis]
MEAEKQCRDGEPCKGVIKKLFPSKRYGFAVCECDKHTGEAHFNYSDLDILEAERACLVVGWRIEFHVIEQHKKTDHCDYRAIQVKPVDVMVVQCEVTEVWENEIALLTCRELTGKIIYVTRNKYNGKFEVEAVTRRDTCRAAVTWEQMKQKKTFALHCSQDTVSPTTGSPFRHKFKTPEKRSRRNDTPSFSDTLHTTGATTASSGFGDELFGEQSGAENCLASVDEQQPRTFGAPALRVLRTSTPKIERAAQAFEGSRFSTSARASPQSAQAHNISRANSTGSICGSGSSSQPFSTKFHNSNCLLSTEGQGCNNGCHHGTDAGSGNSLLRPGEFSMREGRSIGLRRNLNREFDRCRDDASEVRRTHVSPSKNQVFMDSSAMMSMLSLGEQNNVGIVPGTTPPKDQGGYFQESVFGLYDPNRTNDSYFLYYVYHLEEQSRIS